jgi:nicotinamide mononucleotide transporter
MKKLLYVKLNLFEKTLIMGILLMNILFFIVTKDVNLIGIISSITGVICVVLTAKGHISCYYWGIINIITYAIILLQTGLYASFIENALYYLPMQFVGIALWRKNINKETEIVKTRGLRLKEIILGLVIATLIIIGLGMFLQSVGSYLPFLDSTTTIIAIIAMYLSVKRYTEQWFLWIIMNIISIVMWSIALIDGEANSVVMILMWSAYLINAVYGYLNWKKLESK